jgi:glutamine amidotransferase
MVAIVDYGMGNLRSVANAIEATGADVRVTSLAEDVRAASHIVLPGVGAFGDCMTNLRATGLVDVLDDEVRRRGKPFLGICLGMQLLAERSDEGGGVPGLAWLAGRARRFADSPALRVPHMGWNDVEPAPASPMFDGIRHPTFFFVHSYYLPADGLPAIAGRCEYGETFAAAFVDGNIWATQFHPEKSQMNGQRLLQNFLDQ